MFNVKIYGAGSIGNHLAYACRSKGWNVLICDIDPKALERTKTHIYPARYGSWDEKIRLSTINELKPEKFDLVIIGTPPDTHLKLALDILKNESPKVILIEKPLCKPNLEYCKELLVLASSSMTSVLVGYNHILTQNTIKSKDVLESQILGNALAINVRWLEHWGGIFQAHSWLNGPQDTYLGFAERGGGACNEHSHAINIWQYFSRILGKGRIVEVSGMMDIVDDGRVKYDRVCQISVRTEKGLVGSIIQDVITEPAIKTLRIQADKGFLEWYVNYDKGQDAVFYTDDKNRLQKEIIFKTRPDDFKGEIKHIGDILEGKNIDSPISFEHGLETMMVISAAYKSHRLKRTVRINYEKGYTLDAIE